jgi:hypothetical protein
MQEFLTAADLSLCDRRNPAHTHIDANGDDANDPHDFAVVCAVVAEDNGEDDAAEIARRADYAGDDTVLDGLLVNRIKLGIQWIRQLTAKGQT